jgi:hypothetical protein
VIAFDYRALLAGTGKTFVVHLDLTSTKRPERTHKNATLSSDLVVLEIYHDINKTMINTAMPNPTPNNMPVIRPQRSAYAM